MIENKNDHGLFMGYVLWIFGFMGAHRFYYGKKITGILYFLTFGLIGIGWFIDLFLMPALEQDADQKYASEGPFSFNVSWILLTFLGLFGIHRFYLRKYLTGLLWALTAGFFTIGLIYDFWTLNEQVKERNQLYTK